MNQSETSRAPATSAGPAGLASAQSTESPYTAAPYAPTTNAPGRLSLVLGIVVASIGLASTAYSYLLPTLMYDLGWSTRQIVLPLDVVGWVIGALALGAVVAGTSGLGRAGAPKAAAGAGTALGATALAGFVLNLVLRFVA
ncbi:hypothetical protein Bcav_2930 [Beutenbergia cavernae DSM 12333]|uniref:Uncharacterized protein n=1 Tax=Beutenbergia cavernae (strain ATCC BAA-8 / DSM 12333 / CCUG 43141 / JCM 11478 / NBRC 16432 / NCIMB 13614 / HKI 0122) TaxID=471853 RepID=C5BZ60_BEUC1|nr:hypothetical protein [Beutenbergia cavernae]ACQ81175.1 hypothetical protein Bcav_2930 [Beutenbergia cavernae DSM 12333]